MSREDEISWYHGKITRENSEQVLLEGTSFELSLLLNLNKMFVLICFWM